MTKTRLLMFVLWFTVAALAKDHIHVAPDLIKGGDHPEKITDQRAWMMQMIAMTSVEGDSDVVKQHAQLHRATLGLDNEQSTLDAARVHYEQLIANYNNSPQQAAQQAALYVELDALTQGLMDMLQAHVSPGKWKALGIRLNESKAAMGFTIDKQQDDDDAELTSAVYHPGEAKLLRSSSQQTPFSGSSAGYTYYSTLDSDGANWYQTMYVSGTSNSQWTCIWDQYHGQWQPPGCPARHDFYLTNQINGNGSLDLYVGGQQSPTQYISYNYGNVSPVQNSISETVKTGLKIICSVAGPLAAIYWATGVKSATSFFQWTGADGPGIVPGTLNCYVNKKCDNTGQVYAIDGPYVIDAPTCHPAYSCRGICIKNVITGVWTCPSDFPPDTQPSVCFSVPLGSHGQCTVHP